MPSLRNQLAHGSAQVQVKQRPELAQTGVYLLLGPQPDGEGEMLYVGEGDPIKPRLESHYAQKDFWTHAIGFIASAGQLNKAHVQFLEARLIALAKAAKRVPLDNGNQPTEPTLSEADRADMEVFLANMLGMLPVLGVHAFEQPKVPSIFTGRPEPVVTQAMPPSVQAAPVDSELTCHGRNFTASGIDTSQGFVVLAGSEAVLNVGTSLGLSVRDVRRDLLSNGVLLEVGELLKFTQDYVFSSPSFAASLVLGRSANGRIEWKDSQGRTLKELQEAASVA